MEQLFHLNSVGLLYDGMGIVILGFAFFLKSIKAMMVESGTYWSGNNALLESLIQQRTDGVTGTIFLFSGFVLQLLGSLGIRCDLVSKVLLLFLVAISVIYALFLRKKIISIQISKGEALRQQQLKQS